MHVIVEVMKSALNKSILFQSFSENSVSICPTLDQPRASSSALVNLRDSRSGYRPNYRPVLHARCGSTGCFVRPSAEASNERIADYSWPAGIQALTAALPHTMQPPWRTGLIGSGPLRCCSTLPHSPAATPAPLDRHRLIPHTDSAGSSAD